MNIQTAIQNSINGDNLTRGDSYQVAIEIMCGKTTDAQIAALLIALRMKGETIDEITGFVEAMREKAMKIPIEIKSIVDTCGTGGDGRGTFNVSTLSSFVAAGAGVMIAKHGNRSVSSQCGSADLMSALGINIEIRPDHIQRCVQESGIGFLYAPLHHKAMRYAIGPRREIGVRTLFNIIGPLTNPAGAKRQLLGVFSEKLLEPMTRVLQTLGSKHVMVVHGEDGLDEITLTGTTKICELKEGKIRRLTVTPEEFGLKRVALKEIQGGNASMNADITIKVLKGKKGPSRDVVLMNAGAAIYIGSKSESMGDGIRLARESIDSGEALNRLELLRQLTNEKIS
jgi:anthranilate phosphoribosyltransferase